MISQPKPKAAGAIAILTVFMLLHQADRFLVAPLATPIMESFGIREDLMGLTATVAIVVSIALLPLWGYLGDKLARPFVVAASSVIWGITTSASAVAPSYGYFLAARASTGIDDDAYPAVRSLVADYVSPPKRALSYGVLAATGPLGYLLAVALVLGLSQPLGWRGLYLVTGSAGVALAVVISVRVREVQRGATDAESLRRKGKIPHSSMTTNGDPVIEPRPVRSEIDVTEERDGDEPADKSVSTSPSFEFSWREVGRLARRPTFLILVAQGFFGVFPWNVIAFWFFRYLEQERHLAPSELFFVMAVAVVAMSAGNLAGGWIGDLAASRFAAGRIVVSMAAVLTGAGLLVATLSVPAGRTGAFAAMTALTALVIPVAGPNVQATLMEISPPEIRSTASAVQSFLEGSGASLAPFFAGIVAVRSSLQTAIGMVSVVAWAICGLLFALALFTLPKDKEAVQAQLAARLG